MIYIKNCTAVTMRKSQPVIKNAHILIEDGKIVFIGREPPDVTGAEVIDGHGKVIMPGLINCHTHIPMTALRGYADGYDLHTWLNDYIFPAEDKLDGRAVSACTALGLAEMIMTGTTSFSDMYMFCDEIISETVKAGLKINSSRGLTCFADEFDMRTSAKGEEVKRLVEANHMRDGGRVRVDLAIHAEYTSNKTLWESLAGYAAEKGLAIQLHLSETKAEHDGCVQKYGRTPAEVFSDCKVFDVPCTAAHAVWVTDSDIRLLAGKGVTVAHNPVSNLKLASGIAPVLKMKKAGINVALGTDGVSSNNSHDMFEEIKQASIIHKGISYDPTAVTPYEALEMATCAGAAAQGRANECGKLKEGYDADIIMLDFDKPHLIPCHDVISNIVYCAKGSDVVMNMVRGRILYRDGQLMTVDLEKVRDEIEGYVFPKVFGYPNTLDCQE